MLVFGWLVLVVVCVDLLQVIALMLCLFVVVRRFGVWCLMVVLLLDYCGRDVVYWLLVVG